MAVKAQPSGSTLRRQAELGTVAVGSGNWLGTRGIFSTFGETHPRQLTQVIGSEFREGWVENFILGQVWAWLRAEGRSGKKAAPSR